ncbi:MAG: hypothetical protein ABF289_11330, partial [Clostridiales bacterium]
NENYLYINNSLVEGKKFLSNNNKNIEVNIDEYRKTLNKFKKCPICFSDIDNKKIDEIVNKNLEV